VSRPAAARLDGVSFAYRERGGPAGPVLRDLALTVSVGEVVALLGTNGSGKTTLLRLMAGTLRADAGRVELFGRPIGDWARIDIARRVAVLPQFLELPIGFRVAEVVAMGRVPHATRLFGAGPDDEIAVERALLDADAADLADRRVEELSGGERQRVLIALALAQEPDLLLLDEPTLHLDLAHQVALLDAVQRMRRRRDLTLVAVLHDLNLAMAFAPRIALLHDGRIAADGTGSEVLRPDVVRRVFGVQLAEAWTAAGERAVLVTRGAGG
jgi:iron complex transport system ATP-binding protein